ncbi:Methionine import ATP-binding protein MetN [Sporomusa silvacetica DSM 10669]|uniref:Methionine import ATP-binding protein MetN n=1 Tax=Sporomusa silvacetica DSM 10669 TaxID=1123289 RepID=A0ABZ3II57_9FIRM|nr:methionine ABC transporter ATP-binding protein [Sporomusa silvacetica]OZC14889.1 methionine import ATP-binding protein MetN [Sporomusa silvacetica DSM 10669]
MIKLTNVTKTYVGKNDVHALKGVSLTVEPGEIYGIIGLSGAGKSTLIRCINMLEKPTEGSVIVDGQELTSLSTDKLREARKKIGMIFQHFNLLSSRTVYDNIAFPLELEGRSKQEIEQTITPLLELVGLTDKKYHYPSQLSGGQKQRVGIARALANNPEVLLCDEATSALDPQTTKSILELLQDVNRKLKLTIVLITHEMHVIKEICHHVAVIENGLIIEQGKVIDVFTNPQSATAKEFVGSVISTNLPEEIIRSFSLSPVPIPNSNIIARLTFLGESANDPVIASLIRCFDVDVSILFGNIDYIQGNPFGILIISISGNEDSLKNTMDYLNNKNLKVEVIGYVSTND